MLHIVIFVVGDKDIPFGGSGTIVSHGILVF